VNNTDVEVVVNLKLSIKSDWLIEKKKKKYFFWPHSCCTLMVQSTWQKIWFNVLFGYLAHDLQYH